MGGNCQGTVMSADASGENAYIPFSPGAKEAGTKGANNQAKARGGVFIARPGELPATATRVSDCNVSSNTSTTPLDAKNISTTSNTGITGAIASPGLDTAADASHRLKVKKAVNPDGPDHTHLITSNLRDHLNHPGPSDWADRLVLDSPRYPHGTYPGEIQAQEELRRAAKEEYLNLNTACKHPRQNCEFVEAATLKERRDWNKAGGGFLGKCWRRLAKFSSQRKQSKDLKTNDKNSLVSMSDGEYEQN